MEYIRLTVEGPIAVVTIHRPACRNALNSQVYREIIAALQDVRDRDDVRVLLLTGAGDKAFAAGADIAQMVQESPQSGRRLSALCHEAAELLETMRQVTIAAVNGYALGGGCELTLACDLRIASGDTDLKNGLRREADLLGLAFATHDKQEGMTAFLERRKPEFTDF